MILNAIMHVWNEEDIIYAAVKHAFTQGCCNVFIIDNGSTDNTIAEAKAAGGILLKTYCSDSFDESKKMMHINASIEAINSTVAGTKWWLIIDADEFPTINYQISLIEFINSISNDINAIHGFMYNHMPTHPPYNINRIHPADLQPICVKSNISKFPLIKYEHGKEHIFSTGGAHSLKSTIELVHMEDTINLHHFNYRRFDTTFSRLHKLVHNRIEWMDNFAKEYHGQNQSMYHGRLKDMRHTYISNESKHLKTHTLAYNFSHIHRWYSEQELLDSIHRAENNKCSAKIASGIWCFFMKKYDKSICYFNDALQEAGIDQKTSLWVTIKMAECFKETQDKSYIKIIESIKHLLTEDMNEYIYRYFGA